MRPLAVVSGWWGANLVLVALLVALHGSGFAIALYASASLIVGVLALVVWRTVPRTATGVRSFSVGGGAVLPFPLALGLTIVGLGLIWGRWLLAIGVLVIVLSAVPLLRTRPPAEEVVGELPVPAEVQVVPYRQAVPSRAERLRARGRRPLADREPVKALLVIVVFVLAAVRRRPGSGPPR